MKHLLGPALLAAVLSAATSAANAGTFGLFTCGGCCHNFCSPCPRPYNAFSAFPCCAIGNAAGVSCFPPAGADPAVASFGPGPGYWGGQQWYGLQKHWGHAYGFPYDLGLPYPCGALAAFTGEPGMGGCGDPYSGCGTKHHRHHWPKLCCFPDSDSVPPASLFHKLKGHGGFMGHGGDVVVDGVVDGALIDGIPCGEALSAAPATAPVYQPVSYQPSYYPTYYPGYYGGYYPAWGYYPTYGY